ncbi:MAG: hypothetical protein MJE12_10860 [Alphaproteobacteria bacterium]|nr:hypothetical protein [Alphaproteobacteria bacterium]
MLSIRYASSDHYCDDPGCHLCQADHGGERLGHNRCQCCGEINPELFMIRHDLWQQVTHGRTDLLLCWRCTERALGRRIEADDLIDCPLNHVNYPEMMAAIDATIPMISPDLVPPAYAAAA